MFILDEIFTLFSNVVRAIRIWLILIIIGMTGYIGINLWRNDVVLRVPFSDAGDVDDFNMADFTVQDQRMPIIFSAYAPEIGDKVNCEAPCNQTASGQMVSDYLDRGIACPMEIPHYTKIRIADLGIFTCVDKGSYIQIVQKGERDEALTNNQRYFNKMNNVGDPNVIVYAEETHMWVDVLTTVDNLSSYPPYKTIIFDWEIIEDNNGQ